MITTFAPLIHALLTQVRLIVYSALFPATVSTLGMNAPLLSAMPLIILVAKLVSPSAMMVIHAQLIHVLDLTIALTSQALCATTATLALSMFAMALCSH